MEFSRKFFLVYIVSCLCGFAIQNIDAQCTSAYPYCGAGTVHKYVVDPCDCHSYYFCEADNSVPTIKETCPIDGVYDPITEDCNFDTTICPSECPSLYCANPCSPYCFTGDVYLDVTDPCDCHSYFFCETDNSIPTIQNTCPIDGVFNGTTRDCDFTLTTCTSQCDASECVVISSSTVSISTNSPKTAPTAINTVTSKATTTASGTGSCVDSFTCTNGDGNYARCTNCDKSYYSCSAGVATLRYCTDPTVFNTNPDFPFCVDPTTCPYYPSF